MRGVDTNVLVRYLTNDDRTFFELSRGFLEGAEDRGESVFISHVVLCELTWVLRARYRYTREEVQRTLEGLLESSVLQLERRDLVRQALEDFQHGAADFADYLIGRLSLAAGCNDTTTFDTGLRGAASFTVLQDMLPPASEAGWSLMEPR